jgi:hypothetical protein
MGGGYGQNIAAGVEADNITAIITNLFYNGEVGWYDGLYGQAQPSMANFEHWGHFSQIVWKGTTHVGCYTQDCSGQGLANTGGNVSPYFTVCNYKSPGMYTSPPYCVYCQLIQDRQLRQRVRRECWQASRPPNSRLELRLVNITAHHEILLSARSFISGHPFLLIPEAL